MKSLIEYFKTNKKPPGNETAEYNIKYGFNLRNFWQSTVRGSNKQLFEDARKKSPNMKKAYDKILENKDKANNS